jgi:hypothetical protein
MSTPLQSTPPIGLARDVRKGREREMNRGNREQGQAAR